MADAEAAYAANDLMPPRSILETLGEAGDARAQHRLGIMVSRGQGRGARSGEAAEWIGKAAEQGQTIVAVLLARIISTASASKRNSAEAAKSLLKAAAKGNAQAQLLIGRLYRADRRRAGHGRGADLARSRRRAGFAEAQFDLGADLCARRGCREGQCQGARNG